MAGLLLLVLACGIAFAACPDEGPPVWLAASTSPLERAAPTTRVVLAAAARLSLAQGEIVVRASWGDGPGQLGRRDDASRPGPMSLAVDRSGGIHILDQVNRRIAVHDAAGQHRRHVPLGAETVEDLLVAGAAVAEHWILIYEPGDAPGYRVERLAADGRVLLRVPLARALQLPTAIAATGDARAPDVWVELRHEWQVRVVRRGRAVAPAEQRPGPLGRAVAGRDDLRLTATRRSDGRELAVRRAFPGRYTSAPLLEVEASPATRLLAVDGWHADAGGRIFLALVLEEQVRGAGVLRRAVLVHRLGAASAAHPSTLLVELEAQRATDAFRTLAVGEDGAIHELATSAEGVIVRRFRLPPLAADADAGGRR